MRDEMPYWELWVGGSGRHPLLLADKTTPAEDKGPPKVIGVVRGQWGGDEGVDSRTSTCSPPPLGLPWAGTLSPSTPTQLDSFLNSFLCSIACLVTEAEKA